MPDPNFPLLIFPSPTSAERTAGTARPPKFHRPTIGRQRQRLGPKLQVLSEAFEARRVALQQTAPGENPELVLVLEIAGSIQDFANAVAKIPGLEWLVEWEDDDLVSDPDFYDEEDTGKGIPRRLFLVATNQAALNQLRALWDRYQRDPAAKFDHGLTRFKRLFENLKDVRFWSVADRVGADVQAYWEDCLAEPAPTIRFEIESWYSTAVQKNADARAQIAARVGLLGGNVLSATLIPEIAYHGLLVEIPRQAIQDIVAGNVPELLLSDRIMFFRPRAQSISEPPAEGEVVVHAAAGGAGNVPPVVALLDGLPQQNHPLLAGRVDVDDPDGWEGAYEVKDRVHGTSMASLILAPGHAAPLRQAQRSRPRRPAVRSGPRPAAGRSPRQRPSTAGTVAARSWRARRPPRRAAGPTVSGMALSGHAGSRTRPASRGVARRSPGCG